MFCFTSRPKDVSKQACSGATCTARSASCCFHPEPFRKEYLVLHVIQLIETGIHLWLGTSKGQ